jgi:hypothetical protein
MNDCLKTVSWRSSGRPALQYTRKGINFCWCTLVLVIGFGQVARAASASAPGTPGQEDQNCAALTEFNLQALPGGPAIITSAQLVDVPPSGLARFGQSGYATGNARGAGAIHQYCTVTGYVAPQNRFELKLPLASDWNHKFFFYAWPWWLSA